MHQKCSLNPDHTVSHANVCLDVLGRIRGGFQLLAQGDHEDPQGGHVAVPALPPDVLGNKRMRQNLPHISAEEAQQLEFNGCQVQPCPSR